MSEKRSIFEEVAEGTSREAAPKGGVIDSARRGARGPVRALADGAFSPWSS